MFRGAYKVLSFLQSRHVLVKNSLNKRRPFSDLFDKGGKGSGGIEPYHVKLLQVNKGKEAQILELTAQIESLEMQIKALEKTKSAEAQAAKGELMVVLKELKGALRKLRMNK
ncbi:uncharacterized protein LOC119558822 [Drosophila subpulchrella]|uniref:uncharacterized protein LOC119551695 n=1 Tax=Drosophila subpulchrella TaxID=1486046 RepID=UPI0018A16820|nr:uncharacterized protein LOC119551695 [Drosophila subpulchrella]XP_037728022.1 uncharacterized protein LOC119558822 [Drosophila subpulchrella]